jgi:hypothetical protein
VVRPGAGGDPRARDDPRAGVGASAYRRAPLPDVPRDNPWNQRVDQLPVATNSARLIASIGLNAPVHPDFGTVWDGAPNGIPFVLVSNRTRRVRVRFQYAGESRAPAAFDRHASRDRITPAI